ncbi:MAG: YhcH/YjgK/YiaL family protein [Saprospiraceae bacterium]|nr:YhcH/YjgK/YiaL family protein [Saprospiraceae bacterium]MCB9325025.1 YhcH/YjgK/YiaL family protein [Lewinellaceae bacterium]
MVKDKLENSSLYGGLSPKIAKAFRYLHETDLSEIPVGKYDIDDDLFTIVMEYQTKDISEGKFEGHHKYIDVQYVISGNELVGITSLTDQIPIEINEADDYDFYALESDFIRFDAGTFMIFFPDDLHMPCIRLNEPSAVKKVVVKVKI